MVCKIAKIMNAAKFGYKLIRLSIPDLIQISLLLPAGRRQVTDKGQLVNEAEKKPHHEIFTANRRYFIFNRDSRLFYSLELYTLSECYFNRHVYRHH
jgi:hypothetical protein